MSKIFTLFNHFCMRICNLQVISSNLSGFCNNFVIHFKNVDNQMRIPITNYGIWSLKIRIPQKRNPFLYELLIVFGFPIFCSGFANIFCKHFLFQFCKYCCFWNKLKKNNVLAIVSVLRICRKFPKNELICRFHQ